MYNDVHQWYLAIKDAVPVADKYESLIEKFGKILQIPRNKWLDDPFMYQFYKKIPYRKRIFNVILVNLKYALIGFLIGFLIKYTPFIIKGQFKESLIDSLTVGAIAFFACEVLLVFINWIDYKLTCKKLMKLEVDLHDIMVSLPANYRQSEKMNIIAKAYMNKKGTAPEKAFAITDEVYPEFRMKDILGVMFDLPFKNIFITDEEYIAGQQIAELTEEEKIYDNPYLPVDIKSKTFKGSDDAKKDLDKMIGLASVKEQIQKLENRIKFYGSNNNGNHMAFLGSAGTGKTTVARIITKIIFDLGYIKKNQYIEISGDYLKSLDVNGVEAIINYCMGSVLFIDEAYLLYDKNSSNEAIGCLLKSMEDHRSEFVVILAGYEEQMTRLISSNEGFSSRIKHTIYFPDYTVDEMFEIFTYFLSNYNGKAYTISADAIPVLLDTFKLEKQAKSFSNARTVRNAVDSIMDNYAERCINNTFDTKNITIEDVKKYKEDREAILRHELKNSSAANNIDESIISLSELKQKVHSGSQNPLKDFSILAQFATFKPELELLKKQKEFNNNVSTQKILITSEKNSGVESLVEVITGYLYELGYIQENKYLQIDAEFMKGSYVGHTSKRANAIISYATGGVLYIRNVSDLQKDNFSEEVLTAIVNALNSNITIIIEDPQLTADVFTITYEVPKPTVDVLLEIFVNNASKDNFTVQEDAINKLAGMLNNKSIADLNNIYEKAKKKHIANFTEATKYVIIADDIEKPKIKLSFR